MKTTLIGSYPKPPYLDIPDWFKKKKNVTIDTNNFMKNVNQTNLETKINQAIEEIIIEQKNLGINIITDGEIRREHYIYTFCRTLVGIDFENLTETIIRTGACKINCPTVVSKITFKQNNYQSDNWLLSNKIAKKHNKILKFTLPGPMTICDTLADIYYNDDKLLCTDLAQLIRREVLHLRDIGCKNIQIDEPLFARKPQIALKWGIDLLDSIVKDIDDVFFTVHICCGYPTYLDQTDYKKAPASSYDIIADRLDKSKIDAVSIEDAHCHLDLSFLKKIKSKKIVFGTIAIAKSRVETVDEIKSRIQEALKYIEKDRLIIAPDCGLGYLSKNIIYKKLKNMTEAAKIF